MLKIHPPGVLPKAGNRQGRNRAPKPGNRQGCNRALGVPCPSLVTARQGCNRAHDVTRNFHTCVVCLAGGQCLKLIARFPSKKCGGGWWVVVVVVRVSFFSSYTTVQELTPARFTTILTHFLFKSFVLKNLNRFLF